MFTKCIENIVFTLFVLLLKNFMYANYGSYHGEYIFDNVFVKCWFTVVRKLVGTPNERVH